MILLTKEKTILGSGAVMVVIAAVVLYAFNPFNILGSDAEGPVVITLLTNAGVMIEAQGTRIYIDPIDIPSEYSDSLADAILITHDHGDHYQYSTINMLQKEGTINVFPEIMDAEIRRHDGVGVTPGDTFEKGDIKVTAYYMYTFSPDGSTPASHPIESLYTSYIIDIDGFTIFHAGDSKNLPEYTELTGTINVALLPLGPGCQTMCDDEVVNVIQIIKPDYYIPIHYTDESYQRFNSIYKRSIESTTECTVCSLEYFTSHAFETP
jgi:L-ascorbate metabolism protein UlaG (beta-lactamase superfamily)